MNFQEKISALVLFGFIHNQPEKKKKKCIIEIRKKYGNKIEKIVKDYME